MDRAIDSLPGFRRRFRIMPFPGRIVVAVEDDFHCMRVTLHHDGRRATKVEPEMIREPWTTCPGAIARLEETFTGVAFKEFVARGEKKTNCTHLHDLAVLAAAHAKDDTPTVYDILVSDPIEGRRQAELRRNGSTVIHWVDEGFQIVEPEDLAGMPLSKMHAWIASLDPEHQEAARLLRWGALIAHGRMIPLEQQSDATKMPPNCYTFQPEQAVHARRVGMIRDFSNGTAIPLEDLYNSLENGP